MYQQLNIVTAWADIPGMGRANGANYSSLGQRPRIIAPNIMRANGPVYRLMEHLDDATG